MLENTFIQSNNSSIEDNKSGLYYARLFKINFPFTCLEIEYYKGLDYYPIVDGANFKGKSRLIVGMQINWSNRFQFNDNLISSCCIQEFGELANLFVGYELDDFGNKTYYIYAENQDSYVMKVRDLMTNNGRANIEYITYDDGIKVNRSKVHKVNSHIIAGDTNFWKEIHLYKKELINNNNTIIWSVRTNFRYISVTSGDGIITLFDKNMKQIGGNQTGVINFVDLQNINQDCKEEYIYILLYCYFNDDFKKGKNVGCNVRFSDTEVGDERSYISEGITESYNFRQSTATNLIEGTSPDQFCYDPKLHSWCFKDNNDNDGAIYEIVKRKYGVAYNGDSNNRPSLKTSDEGFEYYDTTLNKKILWNGTAWVNLDGSLLDVKNSGTTGERPANVEIGFIYKDTTLNKLIIWDGTDWVNMDGTELTQ